MTFAVLPKNLEALLNRGYAAYKQGDLARAIGDFTRAIQQHPENAWSYYNRAFAHYKLGDIVAALADIQYARGLPMDPTFRQENEDEWALVQTESTAPS